MNASDADLPPASEPDDALLQRLGALLNRVDPVPEALLESARASFALHRLNAELAELAEDTGPCESDLALRADHRPRLLIFEAPRLRIELQVEQGIDGSRLLGQLSPRGVAHLELRDAAGRPRARIEADAAGRFVVDRVPGGAVRLICHRDGRSTATEWTTLA